MPINERRFSTIEEAAHILADDLATVMREALANRGRAVVAVSGGRTPVHVFSRLRTLEIDWARVILTLTDERWVPADHPDSNENLLRTHLLQGPAAAATFVPLYGGEETPREGLAACEKRLREIEFPLDAVYLGMGADGHFASIFPEDPAVDVYEGRCVAVPAAGSRLARMSLTVPACLTAGRIFLLFAGADKHTKYAEARKPGPSREVPVRLILHQEQTPVEVLTAP